jgi:hypothetical protein
MLETIPATTKKKKPHRKREGSVTVYPFEYVEGLLANALSSMFHAIDSLRPEAQAMLTMGKVENARAAAGLLYLEAQTILDCLEPYHDASLNPKHRLIRIMLRCVTKVMEGSEIQGARTLRHRAFRDFATLSKDTLETFHKLLHSDTPLGERENTLALFLETHLPKSIQGKS